MFFKNALLSVYNSPANNPRLIDASQRLLKLGYTLCGSRGTAERVAQAGMPITDISNLTGRGPILGHQVVTLDPAVHAGLLARHTEADYEVLEGQKLLWFDFLWAALYPLLEAIEAPGATEESVTKKIDVGGRALLCAGAKLTEPRIVVASVDDLEEVFTWMEAHQPNRKKNLRRMAACAEGVVTIYSSWSADYLAERPIQYRNHNGPPLKLEWEGRT